MVKTELILKARLSIDLRSNSELWELTERRRSWIQEGKMCFLRLGLWAPPGGQGKGLRYAEGAQSKTSGAGT